MSAHPPVGACANCFDHLFGASGAAAFDQNEIARLGDFVEQLGRRVGGFDSDRCRFNPALSRGLDGHLSRVSPIAIS